MMNLSGIYQIRNTRTNHRYIGSTKNFRKRKKAHYRSLKKGTHQTRIQLAWDNESCKDVFVFEVLTVYPLEGLLELEQKCLDNLQPEYNLNPYALGFGKYYYKLTTEEKVQFSKKMSRILSSDRVSNKISKKVHEFLSNRSEEDYLSWRESNDIAQKRKWAEASEDDKKSWIDSRNSGWTKEAREAQSIRMSGVWESLPLTKKEEHREASSIGAKNRYKNASEEQIKIWGAQVSAGKMKKSQEERTASAYKAAETRRRNKELKRGA